MKVALACGGTGGHIFPGLATGEELRARGHEIILWLAGKDIEERALTHWDGKQHTIWAEGFERGMSWQHFNTAVSLMKAYKKCVGLMRKDRPDVLLGMGSFACVGPVSAAIKLNIPVVLHESNVLPGRAITFFSKKAASVAACFEETRHYLSKVNLTITGMPLRKELEKALQKNVEMQHPFTILCMGGSRGSRPLNEIFSQAVVSFLKQQPDSRVIHIAGVEGEAEVKRYYEKRKVNVTVTPFLQDMGKLYKQTDLAVCRAGAATCAELIAFGVPALLVPYPFATHDHQTENARAMERIGSADRVAEADLESAWLAEYLDGCMNTPARLERMKKAATTSLRKKASELLADEIERIANKK